MERRKDREMEKMEGREGERERLSGEEGGGEVEGGRRWEIERGR